MKAINDSTLIIRKENGHPLAVFNIIKPEDAFTFAESENGGEPIFIKVRSLRLFVGNIIVTVVGDE